jgi:hypothetical protein
VLHVAAPKHAMHGRVLHQQQVHRDLHAAASIVSVLTLWEGTGEGCGSLACWTCTPLQAASPVVHHRRRPVRFLLGGVEGVRGRLMSQVQQQLVHSVECALLYLAGKTCPVCMVAITCERLSVLP